MRLTYARESIAFGWALIVVLIGVGRGYTSMTAWSQLVGLAVVPIVVLALFWRMPAQTLSESIQQARD